MALRLTPEAFAIILAGTRGVHGNLLSSGRISKVQNMAPVVYFHKGFGKGQL